MDEKQINFGVTLCSKCEQLNIAMMIMNIFRWDVFGTMSFDYSTEEILVVEERLMKAIQLANPEQQVRKIRLVSQKELYERYRENNGMGKDEGGL